MIKGVTTRQSGMRLTSLATRMKNSITTCSGTVRGRCVELESLTATLEPYPPKPCPLKSSAVGKSRRGGSTHARPRPSSRSRLPGRAMHKICSCVLDLPNKYMRRSFLTLLLMMSLLAKCFAHEVEGNAPLNSPSDWKRSDRLIFATDSMNALNSDDLRVKIAGRHSNSFINAFHYNLRHARPSEYRTVAERNNFYNYASYLIEQAKGTKNETARVRFFHAATVGTGWSTIVPIDNPLVGSAVGARGTFSGFGDVLELSDTTDLRDAIALLKQLNAEIFTLNLPIIDKLLNKWPDPRNPRGPDTQKLSALDFDLSMVELEQTIVQKLLDRQRPRAQILDVIDLLPKVKTVIEPWQKVGEVHPVDIAARWVAEAGHGPASFANKSYRVATGRAIVFLLHSKDTPGSGTSLDDVKASYLAYMTAHPLPKGPTTIDKTVKLQPWVAAQAAILNSDARGLVPSLYSIATQQALLRTAGPGRDAVIDDFSRVITRARNIRHYADYKELLEMPSLKKYSVGQLLPNFSSLQWSATNIGNRGFSERGITEALYRDRIKGTLPPRVDGILAAAQVVPAMREVVSSLTEKVYSIPKEITWDTIRSHEAFNGYQDLREFAVELSAGHQLDSVVRSISQRLDNKAVNTARDAVKAYVSASRGLDSLGQLTANFRSSGIPSLNIDGNAKQLSATATSIATLALLFGDENTARFATRVANTVDSAVKVYQAAQLLMAGTTGVGAFLAVGGLASSMGGLTGGGDSNAAVLGLLEEMFSYLKQQFAVVNQKLDRIIIQLDEIRSDIRNLQNSVDLANTKLDKVLAQLGRIEVTLDDIRVRIERLEWQNFENCVGYSRDHAKFSPSDNGALSICVTTYLSLLSKASLPENTLRVGNLTTADGMRQLEDDFVEAVGSSEDSLDPVRMGRLTTALGVLESRLSTVAPNPPNAINASFVWHAVSGLSVFDADYSANLPWTHATLQQLRNARKQVDEADAAITTIAGRTSAEKRQKVTDLLGNVTLENGESEGASVRLGSGSTAGSYAANLVALHSIIARAREEVLDESVAYFRSIEARDRYPFRPVTISYSCREGAGTSPMELDTNFIRDRIPPIYVTQGGLSGSWPFSAHRNSVMGPVQICLEAGRVLHTGRFPIGIGLYVNEIEGILRVSFAGHDLGAIRNRIRYSDRRQVSGNPANLWWDIKSGKKRDLHKIHEDDLPSQIANLLVSKEGDVAAFTRERLWQQIRNDYVYASKVRELASRCAGPFRENCTPGVKPIAWVDEIRTVDSARGRFLKRMAEKLRSPSDPHGKGKEMAYIEHRLDVLAAILRVHFAVALPEFTEMVDPLRVMLVGTGGTRLPDGQLMRDILSCVNSVREPGATCDPALSELIENQFFERSGAEFGKRAVEFNSVVSSLPWEQEFNSGRPYMDNLRVRFDTLLDSVTSKVDKGNRPRARR